MTFWPEPLIDAIARRRAVLLIGSGVSANAVDNQGSRPPTWGTFLESAYKKLKGKKEHIREALDSYKYLEACYYLKEKHGENWIALLREAYSKPKYKHAKIHEAILDLDCRIVASLNFDKIYETYVVKTTEGTCTIKNYYDDDIRQVAAGNERYILKPHGTIDTPSNLIFTLEDYARAKVEYASFYEIMTALLHTHTFLCIGCGLSDPDMQWIFEDYRYKYTECPHYMTLPRPVAAQQVGMLSKTRGINILQYSNKDHHKELSEQIVKLGGHVSDARRVLSESMDW